MCDREARTPRAARVTWTQKTLRPPAVTLPPVWAGRSHGPLVLTGSPTDYVLITPAEERMHQVGGKQRAGSPGLRAPQAPTLH